VRISGVVGQDDLPNEPTGIVAIRAHVTLRRAHVEEIAGTGIFVFDDATLDAEDLAVSSIGSGDCVDCPIGAMTQGSGIVLGDYPTVALRRFHLADSALCAVHFISGELDLGGGLVEANRIGLCVEEPDYDLSRLMNDVRYLDNGTNLETTSLPVPEPPSAIIGT